MIKICIFDLDGTLAKTQASIARPVNMTLRHFGLEDRPVEAFNYYAGDGLKKSLERALIDAGDIEASHLEEGYPMCKAWMEEDPFYLVEPLSKHPGGAQGAQGSRHQDRGPDQQSPRRGGETARDALRGRRL